MAYVQHGSDRVGGDRGADPALLAARFPRHRAHRSAHDEAELEALKTAASQRLAEDQRELDLGLDAAVGAGPLEITASRMGEKPRVARPV